VSNGVWLSVTTPADTVRHAAPASYAISPAYRSFDILEQGGNLLILNKATAEVGMCNPANLAYSRTPITGNAVAASKAALLPMPVYASSDLLMVAASGMVGNSLHLLLLPFTQGVATYAWCGPGFTVSGTLPISLSPLLPAMPTRILQLGTETALVFSDGTVAAFPIPS